MVCSSLEYELKAVNKKSMVWFQRGSSIIQLILRRRNVLSLGKERGAQRGDAQRGGAQRGAAKRRGSQRGVRKEGGTQRGGAQRAGAQRMGAQREGVGCRG